MEQRNVGLTEKELKTIRIKDFKEDIPDDFTGKLEYADGSKTWLRNGKVHRTDGPAYEFADGDVEYYINGEKTTKLGLKIFNKLFKKEIEEGLI
jgi:hypothetical protein